jgi:periplasmic copper chaperone A
MRTTAPILAALFVIALGACDSRTSTICVTASAPSIRLPAVPGRPGAGYFEVDAPPGQGDLLSVSSPRAARIEMHATATSSGVTSMRRIGRVTADDCNRFATADGRHLMLFGLDPSLRPGDQVPLIFHFERGEPRTFAASVIAAGEEHAH